MRAFLLPLCCLFALPCAAADEASTSDAAFDELMARIEAMRASIIERTPEGDGLRRAEGYRHIYRMLAQATEGFLDDSDALHPKISRCPTQNCKLGQDNPDNTYLAMQIDGAHTYRVFGHVNDGLGLFQTRSANGLHEQYFSTANMQVAPDGSYEIWLSAQEMPGNWMQTGKDTDQLLVRFFYDDWPNDHEPSMQIEVMGDADGDSPVALLTPDVLASRVDDALGYLRFFDIFHSRPDQMPINAITTPAPPGPFGNPGITNARGRFKLAPGEALLIERKPTRAAYINIQLGNLWWESLDYASRQTSLTGAQSHVDSDGVIRYVIAAEDPGVPNWLDATGRTEGTIHMRWVLPDEDDPPQQASAIVVPLHKLPSHLPADHPRVTAAERSAALQARYAAYQRRLNPVTRIAPAAR